MISFLSFRGARQREPGIQSNNGRSLTPLDSGLPRHSASKTRVNTLKARTPK
jgi:hypothetical protein